MINIINNTIIRNNRIRTANINSTRDIIGEIACCWGGGGGGGWGGGSGGKFKVFSCLVMGLCFFLLF